MTNNEDDEVNLVKHYALFCSELPDREKALRSHLEERGVRANYWQGYHGRTWTLATTKPYEKGKYLPVGHVGLNLGSWAMWQYAYLDSTDDDICVFFEDDVCLPEDYWSQQQKLLLQLEADCPNWNMVFLGVAETFPAVWNKVTERIGLPDSRLCHINEPFGTHAMMLRRSALPILLENMRAAHKNLDQQLWDRVLSKGLLNWCAVLPSIVTQRTFDYTGISKPEWGPSCVDLDSSGQPIPTEAPPSMPSPGRRSGENSSPSLVEPRHHNDLRSILSGGEIQDPNHLSSNAEENKLIIISPSVDQHTLDLIDPLPCAYRSDFSDEIGELHGGRTVPLAKCGRFNDYCFSRPGTYLKRADVPVRSCEDCKQRQYVTPDAERTKLPVPEGHFNPSMIMWKGELILATRDSWGHSKMSTFRLTNSRKDWLGEWKAEAIGSMASNHPDAPRLEDPRLFIHKDKLHASFNLPDGYPPKLVQVGYSMISDGLTRIEDTQVFESPNANVYEKNWVAFSYGDELCWVYAHKPEMVVMSENNVWRTPNKLPWAGGVIRGGAAPIRVWSDKMQRWEMWSFIHGCRKRLQGSVYSAGCIAFNPEPPFNVWRQTPTPLIWPDSKPDDNVVKRYVVWPGGAVIHGESVFIALGIDDTWCRITSIPLVEVDAKLVSESEVNPTPSLIDTVLSTGARK